jgi:hypothetical protein
MDPPTKTHTQQLHPEGSMTGFVILPDHPTSEPIAVQPAPSGGVQVTVGDTSTVLTASEAWQLAMAINRCREAYR